jgi:hypothetical protein
VGGLNIPRPKYRATILNPSGLCSNCTENVSDLKENLKLNFEMLNGLVGRIQNDLVRSLQGQVGVAQSCDVHLHNEDIHFHFHPDNVDEMNACTGNVQQANPKLIHNLYI